LWLGLIGFGLGHVLGLAKHWPRSRVSWLCGLNNFYVIHYMNKHVNGPKHYSLQSVEPVLQLPKDVGGLA